MKILIKNGYLTDYATNRKGYFDIYIEDGFIREIGADLDLPATDIIDARGKHIIPGLVDSHCHLRDPGYEYKEDIETGTASAVMGGFTSVACMPNTNPCIDNQSVVRYILDKAEREGYCNVFPIGAISKGQKGLELAEIGELKFSGAVGISDDGYSVKDASLMKKALEYAAMFDIMVISHCEEEALSEEGVMNEGYNSTILGLRGIPSVAESVIVARDVLLAEYTNTPIHIAHVSTKNSVEIIRDAKKRGVKVTCETCPHYFTLTDEAVLGYNTNAKMNPPLQSQRDVEEVIRGLKDGTIDIIATDHAPHHSDEKNVEFNLAANGIVGFETAFPLAVTGLVNPGHLTIGDLVAKMCVNPAKLLGINKGIIDVGRTADIMIFSLEETKVVDVKKFKSKGKNSPFDKYELHGVVYHTIVNGKSVVKEKILL